MTLDHDPELTSGRLARGQQRCRFSPVNLYITSPSIVKHCRPGGENVFICSHLRAISEAKPPAPAACRVFVQGSDMPLRPPSPLLPMTIKTIMIHNSFLCAKAFSYIYNRANERARAHFPIGCLAPGRSCLKFRDRLSVDLMWISNLVQTPGGQRLCVARHTHIPLYTLDCDRKMQ